MHSGSNYFKVVGTVPNSPLTLPSGPPVYIFDESGVLVDWAADSGEASDFNRRWTGVSNVIAISAEEVKQLLKGSVRKTE